MKYHNIRDASGRCISSLKKKTTKKTTKKAAEKQRIISLYLLDNTGSMSWGNKIPATIEGFNKVVNDSRKADKNNNIDSLEYMALFGGSNYFYSKKVEFLNKDSYRPNEGSTAIYTNTIKAIEFLQNVITKGDKVVLTIFTDGEDTDSRYNDAEKCKDLIAEKNKEGWVINFIGAGDRLYVENVARKMSIDISNTLNYTNTDIGTSSAFTSLASSRGLYSTSVKEKKDKNIGFFAKK